MQHSHVSQASNIRLSICIPTYNFGRYLPATLDSILCQIEPNMEIVIVDGASTDNTEEVVKSYQKNFPQIIYEKLSSRGGIDKDMARTVSLARGEYCWLFSSDDIMKPNAIAKIYSEIMSCLDIYLVGFTIHSLDFQKIVCKHPIFDSDIDVLYDLTKSDQRELFFSKAITTTAFFSFMSSLIIKKATWESVQETDINEFYGGCWAHVARYFSILSTLKVKYLREAYLEKRDGNDSFLDKGLIHRIGIAIIGFNRIANKFLGHDSRDAYQVRRVLRNEMAWPLMLHLNDIARSKQEKLEVKQLTKMLFCDKTIGCLKSKIHIWLRSYWILRLPLRVYYKVKRVFA